MGGWITTRCVILLGLVRFKGVQSWCILCMAYWCCGQHRHCDEEHYGVVPKPYKYIMKQLDSNLLTIGLWS